MTQRQRKNLLKLAAYLEGLPRDYEHFEMASYASHHGDCDLSMRPDIFAATKPQEFLENCGTVACAVGHGPAAGIPVHLDEFSTHGRVRWYRYADRVFGSDETVAYVTLFDLLFASDWSAVDNHHYGAAARIRFFLDTGRTFYASTANARKYAPYRKGSRSAKRREIEAVTA